jgi:hypothetical protein
MFKEFLIKNRLFKSIIERDLRDLSFTHEQSASSSSSEEEAESRRREVEAHQSIIKEQDMLYQSMLSTYTAREVQQEEVDQSFFHLQDQKQALKLAISPEPSPSADTIHITFRTPNGSTLSRHFRQTDSLQYVKDWIFI